ncbi:hypothetical protein K461DRAFT_281931 [Myriangium duriaei CBS 260.36]|uniref:Uncharacterized protein n=1 Tax=Myriangium duriaei CBS 260.36 TaxID=1168546 RepID=A0A9P4MD61_9PEZI|nr:hypothetical protein K461DRAFT_281931 [Myriangium duriaei CBS 260.36]
MANQRPPHGPSPSSSGSQAWKPSSPIVFNDQSSPQPSDPQALATTPKHAPSKPLAPATAISLQPEFGKPSPLRDPTLKQPNIFNSNPRRPEHHKPRVFAPQAQSSSQSSAAPANKSTASGFAPVTRDGFYLPGQKRQNIQVASGVPQISADFFEISKPGNPPPKAIQPAPRPTFSSNGATALGPKTNFQPFKPVVPRQQPNVIVIDDDDNEHSFNPDAAFRDRSFGAVDPYMYVDPTKAGEDIKALLEGAFDDDDDRPKTRLRNRAKKIIREVPKMKTLEEKLAGLEVKAKEAIQDDEHKTDDEEDDGTVEGMAVKLLPHQVEGVSWMLDKESGERKKNGVLPKGGILADDMGLGKTIQSVTLILTNPRPALDAKPSDPKRKVPGKEVGKGTLVVAPLALIKQWEAEIKSKVADSHKLKVLVHHGPSRTKSHLELKKYDVVITTYQIIASEHAGSSDHEQGIKVGCFGVHWYRIILDEAHSIKNRSAKSTQACCALKSWYRWCLTGTPMQNNLDELQSLIHFLRIKPYEDLSHWKSQITGPMKSGRGQVAIKRVQYFLKAFMKRRTKDILKQEGALNYGGKKDVQGGKSAGMKIVERKIEAIICELDDYEREFYGKLEQRANDRLHDMMEGAKTDYIGALVLLLRLRQACNHPQLIKSVMQNDKDALATAGIGGSQSPTKSKATSADVDDLADLLGGLDVKTKQCDVCQAPLRDEEVEYGRVRCDECELDLSQADQKQMVKKKTGKHKPQKHAARRHRNRKILLDSDDEDDEDDEGGGEWLVSPSQHKSGMGRAGGTDDEDAEGGGRSLGSIDSETGSEESDSEGMVKRKARSTTDPTSDSDSDSDSDDADPSFASAVSGTTYDFSSKIYPSTKIRRLLKILRHETPNHKVIVFSQFTTMLDLIQPHLSSASIPFVRYDGSLPNPVREAALHSLRSDPSIRVLLCSLKCGSLGLNLTAASRVVIVEPFWNPFVEEQAIDRVHRLNQTVDVKVYKLTVKDSVEERIIELQNKKRELANAAIEGGKAVAKLSMRDLLGLFGGNYQGGEDDHGPRLSTGSSKGGLLAPRKEQIRGTIAAQPTQPVDDRRRQREKARPRVSNEDPVYGRR